MTSTRHVLVLPFDERTYPDPSPVLHTIFQSVADLQDHVQQFRVLFSTPAKAGKVDQLYPRIRADPVASWDDFQGFLSKVYATLAAGQWSAEKVLLDVEVIFGGEEGHENGPAEVSVLEGFEDLVNGLEIAGSPESAPSTLLPDSSPLQPPTPKAGPEIVALGGTFDHLHAAHKLLLHLSLFITSQIIVVGVVADKLLSSKSNSTLVQSIDKRISTVEEFLKRHGAVAPESPGSEGKVHFRVVEIEDAFGPTAYEEKIDALVVSRETLSGGDAVNKLRKSKGLSELRLFVIEVIASALEEVAAREDLSGTSLPPSSLESTTERLRPTASRRTSDSASIRTVDLSGEVDEQRLKELKMGSTAIRQWIVEHRQ